MSLNLRFFSLLGTAGAGAGVSVPLTLDYLGKDNLEDISLVSDEDVDLLKLTRSTRAASSTESKFFKNIASKISETKDLFKNNKKSFRETIDTESATSSSFVSKKFSDYFDMQKKERDKVSKVVSSIDTKLKSTLKSWKSLVEGENILNQLKDLRQSIKSIRKKQHNVMNWQDRWEKSKLSPKMDELKDLLR